MSDTVKAQFEAVGRLCCRNKMIERFFLSFPCIVEIIFH